jgi:sugar lactone lactonase YvrE
MWHHERKSCFWVDIENHLLFEYNWLNKSTNTWTFERKITLAVKGKDDELILGFQGGIGRFNMASEKLEWLLDLDKEREDIRCNDGTCDRSGRLWIGTLQMEFKKGAGALYLVEKDLNVQKKISDVTISNGIAWSRDNSKMYFIDTPTQKVESYHYEEESGNIIYEKTAINIPKELGSPDGMTIDEEGMLWIGHYGGFGVYRWNPSTGELLEKISLPVPNVTSCSFAGEALDHLFITTARENLSAEELEKYPESGSVFCTRMPVKGVPSNRCSL